MENGELLKHERRNNRTVSPSDRAPVADFDLHMARRNAAVGENEKVGRVTPGHLEYREPRRPGVLGLWELAEALIDKVEDCLFIESARYCDACVVRKRATMRRASSVERYRLFRPHGRSRACRADALSGEQFLFAIAILLNRSLSESSF